MLENWNFEKSWKYRVVPNIKERLLKKEYFQCFVKIFGKQKFINSHL